MPPMSDRYREMSDTRPLGLGHNVRHVKTFFRNTGPTLAKSHDKEWKKDNCNLTVDSSFSFTWVNEAEVKRHVKEICISKSSVIDELSTRF